MKCCALNTSPNNVYLDHISPLSALLKIPLIITREDCATLTEQYYPGVQVRYWPDLEFRLKDLVEEFDTLIECDVWTPKHQFLFRTLYQKEMRLIYCPHGQSDKGYKAPSLAHYGWQQSVFFYGELMKQMLQDLKIPIPTHALVGNFRYLYYQTYRDQLRQMADQEIFSHLTSSNRTLLYAPTWNDLDHSTTFYSYIDKLLKEKPSDWNIIVKTHPLLVQNDPAFFARFNSTKKDVLFVQRYPLIYPILEKIDAYLGDTSSVGYDALAFQKPMFFLKQPHLPQTRLHSCGQMLDPKDNFFESIEQSLRIADQFRPTQASLYENAFASVNNLRESVGVL